MTLQSTATDDSVFFEFPARSYLEKYYRSVGDENAAFLRSIGEYLRGRSAPTDTLIEVAGGPSLFSLMAVAAERQRPFRHVTFTDIGWKNLREIDCWLRAEPYHFDYQPLLDWLHGEMGVDRELVVEALRGSSWELAPYDWHKPPPAEWRRAYDVVSAHFFAESATSDEAELVNFLVNVSELGRPGAVVLLSFMCRSDGYVIAGRDFPAFSIDEKNVFEYLGRAGFSLTDVELRTAPTEDPESMPGYDGMLFIGGRLSRQ
jgi:NNMT/PNMT/TEMT family protein